jgi:hypothetical protein
VTILHQNWKKSNNPLFLMNSIHRYFRIPLLALVVLALAACKKDDVGPGFDMDYQGDFIIPPGIGVFEVHHFQLNNIPTRYEQLLDLNNLTDTDIKGIVTQSAAITGIFGDADLDFVDQVSLRVYDLSDPTDYLEMAYRQPVPLDLGNALDLIPSQANGKRFMTGNRFGVDVVLWLRRTTTEETSMRMNLRLKALY